MPDVNIMGTNTLMQRNAKFQEAKAVIGHVNPGKGTNPGEQITAGAVSTGGLPLKH